MSSPRAADSLPAAPRDHDAEAATTEVRPIVICEECGRKYSVSPSKIQGNAAGFTCRHCGHRIVVARTAGPQRVETLAWPAPPTPAAVEPAALQPLQPTGNPARRLTLLSVFGVFLAVAIAGAAGFFMVRLHGLLSEFERQGLHAAREFSRERVERVAAAAAGHAYLLFGAQPEDERSDLAQRSELASIVIPPVGGTGQIMLYSLPGSDGAWRVRLHSDPNWIGADLSALRADLGPHFPDFWETITGAAGGTPASGHYRARGPDGKFRLQAMACCPVAGTEYVVAAAGPVEELAGPLAGLQRGAVDLTREIGLTAACLLGGTAVALALLALLCRFRR
ncbi:MAG: zinc-ribbon domain-containing protein [Desulfobacterales bacterium]